MIFDTFLFRFELRTGCIVMAVLHMILSIGSLENAIHQSNFYYFLLVLSERIFEMCLSAFLFFASILNKRGWLKLWMFSITPVFLFNVSYSTYQSLVKHDSLLGLILLGTLYVITISLMLVHSFYDELGVIENYLKDLAELRALRSAQQPKDREDSVTSKMEMFPLSSEKRVRTDEMGLTSREYQESNIENFDQKKLVRDPTSVLSDSSADSSDHRRERTALTSFRHLDIQEIESSINETNPDVSVTVTRTSVREQQPVPDSSESETPAPRTYIPRSRQASSKLSKPKPDSF